MDLRRRVQARKEEDPRDLALLEALLEDIDSTGRTDLEIGDETGVGKSHISRVRQRLAHAPNALVRWATENSRHQPPRYLRVACSFAQYEPKPKPPPDLAERYAVLLEVLRERGDEHVLQSMERRLGAVGLRLVAEGSR
jgi:hypothetical protein